KVGDEAVHKELGDRMERAATTAFSLEAEHDREGTDCLPTATIFEELARIGAKSTAWNEFSSTMASLIICLATNQKFNLSKYIFEAMVKHLDGGVKFLMYPRFLQVFINQQLGDMLHHKKIFVNPVHTKKVFANMKRAGKDFSRRITPLFDNMMVQDSEEVGEDSDHPTDSNQILIIDHSSTSSQPKQKQKSKRRQRKEAEVPQDETEHEESVPTPSNDPQPSGEDSMQLNNFDVLCTKLQALVLDLKNRKDAQAKRLLSLKKRVRGWKGKKKSRTTGLKRLKKVGMSRRVESSEDPKSLGDHEDASKQGRSIEDIDADIKVTLVDETQERQDEDLMFDTGVLDTDEMHVEAKIDEKYDVAPTTIEEITLAQTLIQIKAAKPKDVTTVATTTTTTRPKARGVVVQEPSEFRTSQESQPSITKDKGKAIMIEPEVPLKRKDQVSLHEQMARDVHVQLEAELIKEEKLARKQEEEANIALIESWDNTQAMMEADFKLAQERNTLQCLKLRRRRRKTPTKAQKRNQMSTYLKNMGGYKHNQLNSKSYEEIQKMFGNEMRRVNTFIPMDSVVVKSKKEIKESSKGTEDELESDKLKKAESDKEKAKGSRKKMLVKEKAGKEQQQETSKESRLEEEQRVKMKLKNFIKKDIDREDLLTLWKLVKTKHGDIRPEVEHERVMWVDFKVMFEPDIRSKVWRDLQGNSQVKDNKIDLLVQQYKQFTILKEESIDSGFARFNTIITSLKALDEGFSGKNYVRKFLRALHPNWRAKVMMIEESKDLSSLALDELIDNLKVHEVVMEKDSKIYRVKKERVKSIALKAKK
ncbi:hypothetical protein Tco_0732043, partial [Tanacetum coccineum]